MVMTSNLPKSRARSCEAPNGPVENGPMDVAMFIWSSCAVSLMTGKMLSKKLMSWRVAAGFSWSNWTLAIWSVVLGTSTLLGLLLLLLLLLLLSCTALWLLLDDGQIFMLTLRLGLVLLLLLTGTSLTLSWCELSGTGVSKLMDAVVWSFLWLSMDWTLLLLARTFGLASLLGTVWLGV